MPTLPFPFRLFPNGLFLSTRFAFLIILALIRLSPIQSQPHEPTQDS